MVIGLQSRTSGVERKRGDGGRISCFWSAFGGVFWGQGERTEDELFRRGEHVKREGDFVLVAFALQPSNQVRGIQHGGKTIVCNCSTLVSVFVVHILCPDLQLRRE